MFYHVSLRFYPNGWVIQPGSYGAMARSYMQGNPVPSQFAPALMWELAFETARLCVAPESVSRLDCVFVWDTEEQARRYREQIRAENRSIFEVVPVDTAHRVFRGDFDLIEGRAEPYVDYMSRDAVAYWRDPPKGNAETLVSCPVRVVRHVG